MFNHLIGIKIYLIIFFILSGCMYSEVKVSSLDSKKQPPQITQVKIENSQLIVSGSNLDSVTLARVEGSTNHTFLIETKTPNQLVLNAQGTLNFLAGQALNLLVSDANAAATFPISFELQNGQVTAVKLSNMGATTGQFLRFNGVNWAPATITTGQSYAGTFNAATETPDIGATIPVSGTYYIVTVGGSPDLGNGPLSLNAGDILVFNGINWESVAVGGLGVTSFNGRDGVVAPLAGDYTWDMLAKSGSKLTGSSLVDIADVDTAGIADGNILKWDEGAAKWIAATDDTGTVADGAITTSKLADASVDSNKIINGSIVDADVSGSAAIAQSKIANLTTDLASKEAKITATTSLDYYRGDKTFAPLNTAAIPESGTNYYFTDARVMTSLLPFGYTAGTNSPLIVGDTLSQALSKLEGQNLATSGALSNYVLKTGSTMSGPLAMGANKISGLADPTFPQDASTKAYVDSKLSVSGTPNYVPYYDSATSLSNSPIAVSGTNIGIGTTTPAAKLEVQGQVVSREYNVATGAAVDFANGNIQSLSNVGGSTITLTNIVKGGTYTLVITDTTSRKYTFNGCDAAYFSPSNAATADGTRSVYSFLAIQNGAGIDCYISWITGFN